MLIAVLAGILVAIGLFFVGKRFKKKASVWLSLLPLGLFVYFLSYIPSIASGEVIRQKTSWIPSFGVDLSFQLDGLSLLFSLMITGVGTLVFAYTASYLKGHEYLDRFYGYLSLFMAAMIGLVLSDNLISLFVFWELTSISSFYLIGFNNTSEASRKSALTALGITGIGGLFLLAGALLLGVISDTYSIAEMLQQAEFIKENEFYILAVVFIFGAAFTKSAQFPFHFWLPGAMKAPTPVSTYLHSATMVKAGVYLLLRFSPVLGNTEFWNSSLLLVGAITMLYSAFHIVFRTDLKGILAYSTITALGILVFLIGLGTQEALIAALIFIVVHALYKASLFLITGIIDHETGTRDVTKLSGLRKVLMPVAIAGFIAAIISGGVPPSIGFVGKDLIYEATLGMPTYGIWLTAIAIVTNILLFYAGFVAGVKPFMGKLPEQYQSIHLPSWLMWFPPLLMVTTGVVFGIFPQLLQTAFVEPAISGLVLKSEEFHLKLWHGFNTILGLSAITMGVGVLLYVVLKPSHRLENFIQKLEVISPERIMRFFTEGFQDFSLGWTNLFQNGYLRHYIATIVGFLVLALAFIIFSNFDLSLDFSSFSKLTAYEIAIVLMMIGAVLFTILTNSRLTAVASMGVVGFAFCLLFLFYSAPDLAMTQFSVDTLTVILFVLVLYKLPVYLPLSKNVLRLEHGILSIAFGSLISILVLKVLQEEQSAEISSFYAENSYLLAKGKNVVNVILVDFRGVDTLIEICVLIVAALGVFGLLKLRLRTRDKK